MQVYDKLYSFSLFVIYNAFHEVELILNIFISTYFAPTSAYNRLECDKPWA